MSENGGLCFEMQKHKQTTTTKKNEKVIEGEHISMRSHSDFHCNRKMSANSNDSTQVGQGCNNHFIAPW